MTHTQVLAHILPCLLCLLVWVSQAGGQGTGNYYNGTSTEIGVSKCPVKTCISTTPFCLAHHYRASCSGISEGTCTLCTVPTRTSVQFYNNSAQQTSATCTLSSCPPCNAGSKNTGCTATSPGSCSACAAPAGGSYYPPPTDSSVNCVSATCAGISPQCTQAQKRINCGGNLPGTCDTCGTITTGNYWTHALNAAVCTQASYVLAGAGQYYPSKTATSMGTIANCPTGAGTPTTDTSKYFVTPTTLTTDCQTADKTICAAGKQNTGSNTTSAGVCTADCTGQVNGTYWTTNAVWNVCASTACNHDICAIGQWKSGCTGTSAGLCAACTTANASQVYESKGGWANTCMVKNCVKVCGLGKYITGCGSHGATEGSLGCGDCNNAPINQKFWTGQGAYLSSSCPTSDCVTCTNGNFRSGCGGLSGGVCDTCINTV